METPNKCPQLTVSEFCAKHRACEEGHEWALANCASMREAWDKAKLEWLIWIATRDGVLTDRDLRLFAVWSARQVQYLMVDPRSLAALDVAERHADGLATVDALATACAAAWDAAWDASNAAAWAASNATACAAASDASRAASRAAAWAASNAASRAAAGDAQATWLRANTQPNFSR